jgi:carboxyl-terminal processing protease
MVIIAPMKGSPAEEAGLEPGDIILAVDGTSTDGKSVTEVALIIQGPAGTPVMLSILKNEAEEPVDVKIVRGEIKLETVVTERRENIGYIQLVGFLQTSDQDLREGLQEIIGAGVDGIVLDLRNNPGGLLNVAVNVASEFISVGVVVDVVDSEGVHSSQSARKGGVALDIPMVVLVNEGSASASEVVAGAFRIRESDNHRLHRRSQGQRPDYSNAGRRLCNSPHNCAWLHQKAPLQAGSNAGYRKLT